ncbi:MAG: type II toxin-antitoxin system VapC family toxin [Sinobacteraceae bacterium]|nr:type II toxin-antitoxin system VapC family toxin [Nevskiaceae bacterium]
MPRYLLDTDVCIYIINRRPPGVFEHFSGLEPGQVGISSITRAELDFGVAKSGSKRNRRALDKFLLPLELHDFGAEAARAYGNLRAHLEAQGAPIGAMDTLIAAHALALGHTLVTNNTREFRRVPGLHLENWVD